MLPRCVKKWAFKFLLAVVLLAPNWAQAITFESIVVFGGSVSDSGNAFALLKRANKPPYGELDQFLVPTGPYAKGGHHFSNGATWIEQLARKLKLNRSVQPAFASSNPHATNYAVGAARARDDGINVNMTDQVSAFLGDFDSVAPSDALYVIDFGGNDVRDALLDLNPGLVIQDALGAIASNLGSLYAAGARKFLVVNVVDIGMIPSIRILDSLLPGAAQGASILSQLFNSGLDNVLASLAVLPGVEIAVLDVYGTVNELIANPGNFGLTEVEEACITPNVRPFTCKKPDKFLFWDGVHPTKAVHAVFAQGAANVLGQ
jgi:phospholipase/lecithinase/hemolysin